MMPCMSPSSRSPSINRSNGPATFPVAVAVAVVTALLVAGGLWWDGQRTASAIAEAKTSDISIAPPRLSEPVSVVFVGDSYVEGAKAGGNGSANWTRVLANRYYKKHTPLEITNSGRGSSGYVKLGIAGTNFQSEAERVVTSSAQVVVFFGSRNDAGLDVYPAATETYAMVRRAAPNAKLLVVGPQWVGTDVPPAVRSVSDRVRQAANEAGAIYVDPIAEGWFTGESEAFITDGIHPNDEGHRWIADQIEPQFEVTYKAVPKS